MSKSKTTSNSPNPTSLLTLSNEKNGMSADIYDQLFQLIILSFPADFSFFSLDRVSKEVGLGELDVVLLLLMDYPYKICLPHLDNSLLGILPLSKLLVPCLMISPSLG